MKLISFRTIIRTYHKRTYSVNMFEYSFLYSKQYNCHQTIQTTSKMQTHVKPSNLLAFIHVLILIGQRVFNNKKTRKYIFYKKKNGNSQKLNNDQKDIHFTKNTI